MKTLIHILTIAAACMIAGAKIETVPNDTGAKTYSARKTGKISREQAQELRKEAGMNGIRKVLIDSRAGWIIIIADPDFTRDHLRNVITKHKISI